MFCSRRGHWDMGADGGNLPHESEGTGDVGRHRLPLVRNTFGDTDLSFSSDRVYRCGSFSALRSCLHRGIPLCLAGSSRDQRQDSRGDRNVLAESAVINRRRKRCRRLDAKPPPCQSHPTVRKRTLSSVIGPPGFYVLSLWSTELRNG